jgi:hypothetical protein
MRKVYLHYTDYSHLVCKYTVTVTQNSRVLHTAQVTNPPGTPASGTIPGHRTVDVPDVRVEAGTLQIQIQIRVTNNRMTVNWYYPISPPGSCLSDDHIRATFPAGIHMAGIEYSPTT